MDWYETEIKLIFRKKTETMKIAVTYENGKVFPHFGHTEQFKIYEIEGGKLADAQVVKTNGSGHGALAGMLPRKNEKSRLYSGDFSI